MDTLHAWWLRLITYDIPLIRLGGKDITVGQIGAIVFGTLFLFAFASWIRRCLAERLLARRGFDVGTRWTIASLVRYVVIVAGMMAILQTSGIDLTTFNVVAGAVGVGLGFGLQNVVSNFISGLIVMFERPIKVGDRIEISGMEGEVVEIGARSTRLRTGDYSVLIVPNQKIITEYVRNWEASSQRTPLILTLAVEGTADPHTVCKILAQSAEKLEIHDKQRPPTVQMLSTTGGHLNFKLFVWARADITERSQLVHNLNMAIMDALNAAQIKIV